MRLINEQLCKDNSRVAEIIIIISTQQELEDLLLDQEYYMARNRSRLLAPSLHMCNVMVSVFDRIDFRTQINYSMRMENLVGHTL